MNKKYCKGCGVNIQEEEIYCSDCWFFKKFIPIFGNKNKVFFRKRKILWNYQRIFLIKMGLLIGVFMILNVGIKRIFPEQYLEVLIASLIAFITLAFTILIDFLRDKKETEEVRTIYSRAEDALYCMLIKLFSYLRIPRKVYLEVTKDTIFVEFEEKFFKEFNKYIHNFLEDKSLKYTEEVRKELTENIKDLLIKKFDNTYETRKNLPLSIMDKMIRAPFFTSLHYKDQEEIYILRDRVKGLIESVDNSVKKEHKKRIKEARGDTSFICTNIRRAVLSWYILYCKANNFEQLSWEEIKISVDEFRFDNRPS